MSNTILQTAAKEWWNNWGYNTQVRLMDKYGIPEDVSFNDVSIEQITEIYNGEHPTQSPNQLEEEIQQRKELEIPFEIKKQFVEAAKNSYSIVDGNIVVNSPEAYKAFRAGQDCAYEILKQIDPVATQSINEEYSRIKKENEKLREALQALCGIEPWIGDKEMKELFQKIVYGALDQTK